MGPQGGQGPGHRIVLEAGDHRPSPRRDQGADGDVQAVGGVKCEHHPLRVRHAEQVRRRLTAPEGGLRGQPGRLMK